MVNRRLSMDMMMNVAESQPGRQFIFLTPQDMSSISIDPSIVRISQMRAPERGQTALPFRPEGTEEEEEEQWYYDISCYMDSDVPCAEIMFQFDILFSCPVCYQP